MDLSQLFTSENLIALGTLTALEVVLGIDNIVFIAILVGRLPPAQRDKARLLGLFLAMFMRVALLFAIVWVMKLDQFALFDLPWDGAGGGGHGGGGGGEGGGAHGAEAVANAAAPAAEARNTFTGKDAVLFLGGLFLVAKATYEIHHKIETGGAVEAVPHDHGAATPVIGGAGAKPAAANASGGTVAKAASTFSRVIIQILLLDLVFSIDSVITAVGMAKERWVMVTAVVIAVGVMLAFSGFVTRFVERHPTIKMLALSFLILIGVMLVAESTGQHIQKGYIYFAMAFSLGVEMLNIWTRGRADRKRAAAAG